MCKYYILSSFLSLAIFGCESSDTEPEKTDTTYVNVTTGSDFPENGKSRADPYKTISYALNQSTTTGTIEVASGIYDVESGEQFPIIVPSGKKLIGETIDADQQVFALISGAGDYSSKFINGVNTVAVVFENASTISDLVIKSNNGVALWVEEAIPSSLINNVGLVDSQIGLTLVGNTSPIIMRSRIEKNRRSGVEVLGNSTPIFLDNSFRENEIGVFLTDNAKPSFGGSTGGGGNSILENSLCDLLHSGIESLNTIGTRWDKDVFNFSIKTNCSRGAEIVINRAGSVNYQFIPPKDNLIFNNTNRIPIVKPIFGEILVTQEPQFVWSSSSANIAMIAVWDQPPVTGINEILDVVPIYWFWHSGLNTGGSGFVQHSDGRSPTNNVIEIPQPPRSFEVGRSYYWAVWEWDENGKEILASSSLNYFRVK